MSIQKGDTVQRVGQPEEVAVVTYVDAEQDYAELQYPTGFCFRSLASSWERRES